MKSLLILLFYLCSTAIHAFAQYEQALLKQLSHTGDDSVRFYIYRGLGYIYEFDDSAKSNEYYREEQNIANSYFSAYLLDSAAYYGIQSIESSTLCKDTATLILTCANLNIY